MTVRTGICAGIACTLALAGCGTETNPQPAESEPVAAATETGPTDREQGSSSATLDERSVGPVSFGFDSDRLAALDTSISVPPDWDRRASGVKLIEAGREQLMGLEECPYGQAGRDLECTPESEAGLAIAMLDDSFEDARERLPVERTSNVRLAGREGIAWSIGVEGESTEYTLLPAGDRTVLIERRIRNRENPDAKAIEQVLDTLRIES